MKIAILNSVISKTTSTGKLVCDIGESLLSYGEQVVVYYSQEKADEQRSAYAQKFGYKWENKLHALLSRITGKQGYYSYFGTKSLINKLKRQQPDIVHLHNLHSNDICLPLLFKYLRKAKIKTVVNLHDCWYYTGRCYHYTKDSCYQWKEVCKGCPSTCRSNPYWFFKRSRKLLKDKKKFFSNLKKIKFIGVSKWIVEQAKQSTILQDKDICYIYNWVDLQCFSIDKAGFFKKENNLEKDKIVLAVCGKWVEEKGLIDLLHVGKKLPKHIKLVMIGKIDDSIKEKYKKEILFLPPVYNKEKLAQAYADADVYLNLSREESFGLTNAEALSCGTPIVVYNSTASPEFVTGECGYVAKVGNVKDVVYGIEKVLIADRAQVREKCSLFAKENFDKERNIEKYYRIYQSL